MLGLENIFTAGSFREFTQQIVGIAAFVILYLIIKLFKPFRRSKSLSSAVKETKRLPPNKAATYMESMSTRKATRARKDKKESKNVAKKDRVIGKVGVESDQIGAEASIAELDTFNTSRATHELDTKLKTETELFDKEINSIAEHCNLYAQQKASNSSLPMNFNSINICVTNMFAQTGLYHNKSVRELKIIKQGIRGLRTTLLVLRTDFRAYLNHVNKVVRKTNAHIKEIESNIRSLRKLKQDTSELEHKLQEIKEKKAALKSINKPDIRNLRRFVLRQTGHKINNLKIDKLNIHFKGVEQYNKSTKDSLTEPVKLIKHIIKISRVIFEHRKQYPVVLENVKEIDEYLYETTSLINEIRAIIGYAETYNMDQGNEKKMLAYAEYKEHEQLEEDIKLTNAAEKDLTEIEKRINAMHEFFMEIKKGNKKAA